MCSVTVLFVVVGRLAIRLDCEVSVWWAKVM